MREKVIFDGVIEGPFATLQNDIHIYYQQLIDDTSVEELSFENIGNKKVWIVPPEISSNHEKLINGYTEVNPVSLNSDLNTALRIISCREELDLLYFQLSQRIQAKYLIPNLSFYATTLSWKELVESGYIQPAKKEARDIIFNAPDPDETAKKYGTDGDLTANQIRQAVKEYYEYRKRNGSKRSFYYDINHWIKDKCAYNTWVGYTKNEKYKPKDI